mmetsp:Transcript_4294/g.12401  ORF Transcript_4294/g.12401 Transcript_4294/m.12401 type:complete len:245 (-) Transcript_4294:218-952(-)
MLPRCLEDKTYRVCTQLCLIDATNVYQQLGRRRHMHTDHQHGQLIMSQAAPPASHLLLTGRATGKSASSTIATTTNNRCPTCSHPTMPTSLRSDPSAVPSAARSAAVADGTAPALFAWCGSGAVGPACVVAAIEVRCSGTGHAAALASPVQPAFTSCSWCCICGNRRRWAEGRHPARRPVACADVANGTAAHRRPVRRASQHPRWSGTPSPLESRTAAMTSVYVTLRWLLSLDRGRSGVGGARL